MIETIKLATFVRNLNVDIMIVTKSPFPHRPSRHPTTIKEKPPKEGVADMIVGAATVIVKAINNPTKEKPPTKVQGLSPLKAMLSKLFS